MDLAKEGWNFWDDWGIMKVTELLSLTRMAGGDEPLHIFITWATRTTATSWKGLQK